ncbi:MAG: AMP-binding protein [Deltaproteobacteria bacterium]|nr:AMP-binding protein [Deltaproteobacteria bacterium]
MAHPGHHALARPHDPALVVAPRGETVSWGELRRRIVQTANALHDLGLRPGDPIAFCVENRSAFAVLVWACQDAGLRYTPVSTRLTPDEVQYIVADCGARVFVHTTRTAASEAAVAGVHTIDLDEGNVLDRDTGESPRYERREGVAMLYSSGTTGRPKGVWRPAPPAPIEELPAADRMLALGYGIGPGSVYLSPAPLYHSAPLSFLLQMGRIGAATLILERFDPLLALECIERHRVTHSQWVPTMFVRMLRLSDDERKRHDLSSHRFAIHGAGPCPIPVKEAMLDWWGPIIHEYYAGTEGAGTCVIGPNEWLAHKGSVGRSVRGLVTILDEAGKELPAGAVGQVWFTQSSEFRYHNDDAKTSEARTPSGGGSFGDIGYLDDEGFLYLTGRKAFTIIVGGINVYPREIEEVLLTHPSVHDVAVFGIPDDEYGEQVKAVVEPEHGSAAGPDLERRLIEHCRRHLATFKLPRSIDFMRELPREPTGKLRTGLLRQSYLR